MIRRSLVAGITLLILAGSSPAFAHFPWIAVENGRVVYFFGEDPSDRTYKLPPSIAKAEIVRVATDGGTTPVATEPVEKDNLVGLTSQADVPADAVLASKVTFGLYNGNRLNYYTQYYGGTLPTSRPAASAKSPLELRTELVQTEAGLDVYVLWKGKPLSGVTVKLYCEEGHEEGAAETDADGRVAFTAKQVEPGLNGLLIGHTVADESGTYDGREYKSASHYLTVTFDQPRTSSETKPKAAAQDEATVK